MNESGEQRNLLDQLKEQEIQTQKKRAKLTPEQLLDQLGEDSDRSQKAIEAKQRFIDFHDNNPHVFEAFAEYTLRTIAKGFEHYGAMGIVQIIRWHTGITTQSKEGFKINNNYVPFYARTFEAVYPEHRGFFRMRSSYAD